MIKFLVQVQLNPNLAPNLTTVCLGAGNSREGEGEGEDDVVGGPNGVGEKLHDGVIAVRDETLLYDGDAEVHVSSEVGLENACNGDLSLHVCRVALRS